MTAFPSSETAARCLVAAAEHCEALEAIVELMPGAWFVHFETGGECLVELTGSPPRLVVTTGIGEPAEQARAGLHARCLDFNALWSELGPMRLAKDEGGEQLLLINDVLLDDGDEAHIHLVHALLRHEGLRLFWLLMVDNARTETTASMPLPILSAQMA